MRAFLLFYLVASLLLNVVLLFVCLNVKRKNRRLKELLKEYERDRYLWFSRH